jgi:hypothetical protein
MSSAVINIQYLRRMAPGARRIRLVVLVWGLLALAGTSITTPVKAQAASSRLPVLVQASNVDVTAKSELVELNAISQSLVERARGGRADAVRFRIDATLYRESLRRLMLISHDAESARPGSNQLYLDMVRMAALLNAAAECKTGRYITCPVELMRQLDTQQKLLNQNLDTYLKEPQ